MKAKELMLFDLVKRKKDGKTMTVVELRYAETIAAITPDDVYYGDMEDYHESEIEPIPITPEILERNGFTYSQRESNSLCRAFVFGEGKSHTWAMVVLYELPIAGCKGLVQIETDSQTCNGINKVHNCDIYYVHELQHALRMCKIEKEIVL